jgi:hypothetical protein
VLLLTRGACSALHWSTQQHVQTCFTFDTNDCSDCRACESGIVHHLHRHTSMLSSTAGTSCCTANVAGQDDSRATCKQTTDKVKENSLDREVLATDLACCKAQHTSESAHTGKKCTQRAVGAGCNDGDACCRAMTCVTFSPQVTDSCRSAVCTGPVCTHEPGLCASCLQAWSTPSR